MPGADVESMPALFPGDIVASIASGTIYRIERTKQIKAVCADARGKLWEVRMPGLRDATDAEKELFRSQLPDPDPREIVRIGHAVRFKGANAQKYPGTFVVIKDKDSAVSLVRLGGDISAQYMPTVPTSMLEVVKGEITFTNV